MHDHFGLIRTPGCRSFLSRTCRCCKVWAFSNRIISRKALNCKPLINLINCRALIRSHGSQLGQGHTRVQVWSLATVTGRRMMSAQQFASRASLPSTLAHPVAWRPCVCRYQPVRLSDLSSCGIKVNNCFAAFLKATSPILESAVSRYFACTGATTMPNTTADTSSCS